MTIKPNASKNGNAARRIVLAAICTAGLIAPPIFAQEPSAAPAPQQQAPQGPGSGGWQVRENHQIENLTRALKLTPDQVSQIKAIQQGTRQQMIALHQDAATPQADKRAKMMSLHETETSSIKAVLNDEQKAKFDAMQARQRERREEREQEAPAAPAAPPAA